MVLIPAGSHRCRLGATPPPEEEESYMELGSRPEGINKKHFMCSEIAGDGGTSTSGWTEGLSPEILDTRCGFQRTVK